MAYGVSDGHETDDVALPSKVKLVTPNTLGVAGDAIINNRLLLDSLL